MNIQFKVFILGLVGTFALPWFFLLVLPAVQMSKLKPQPYYERDEQGKPVLDEEGNKTVVGYYPPALSGSQNKGQQVYVEQGCTQCHSQFIRPTYAGWDSYKVGWGSAPNESMKPVHTRFTTPYDYLGEDLATLGIRRYGGDLSNVGFRYSRGELHLMLYRPRLRNSESTMPSYRFLYETKRIQGARSEAALALTGEDAPEAGYEVVPGDDAEALVDYLLSLRKNYDLPAEIAPKAFETMKKQEAGDGA